MFDESRRIQLTVGLPVLLAAVGVMLYALPRFDDALQLRNMYRTSGALLRNEKVDPGQLRAVVDDLSGLNLQAMPADQRAMTGYLAMRAGLVERPANPELAKRYFTFAESALVAALAERPADSYSWVRLALVRLELNRPVGQVLQAWRLSVATAPFEPQMIHWRLRLGLRVYAWMGPEDRALVKAQVAQAWTASRWKTTQVLADYDQAGLLRPDLSSPDEVAEFDKHYRWFASQKQPKAAPAPQ